MIYDPDSLIPYKNNGTTKERLLASLKTTADLILRMQDRSENSPTYGALNLFYDYDAKTYRRPHWIWSNGPSIKLLLDIANDITELQKVLPPKQLKETSIKNWKNHPKVSTEKP